MIKFLFVQISFWCFHKHFGATIRFADAFAYHYQTALLLDWSRYHHHQPQQQQQRQRYLGGHGLSMTMAPIGPFCPFPSNTTTNPRDRHKAPEREKPMFVETFARIQFEIQLGRSPDPQTLRAVADEMDEAIDQWDERFEKLESDPDFRSTEYATLAEAHLTSHGTSTQTIALLVRWQSASLRALADNRPAPVPPPGLDLQSLMEKARRQTTSAGSSKTPSMTSMQAAERITATPFDVDAFDDSEATKAEYTHLVQDHSDLIEKGRRYKTFNSSEKLSFLDQIESVEKRWKSFFSKLEEKGSLNREYIRQCEDYLSNMKLTEEEYFQLLDNAHRLMRQDARREGSSS